MTATVPNTADEATPMAHTADMRADPPAEAVAAAESAATVTRPRRWAIVGDNPFLTLVVTGAAIWLTVLGIVTVALLLFILDGQSIRLLTVAGTVAAALLTVAGIVAAARLLFILNDP